MTMDREIELKFPLDGETLQRVKQKLEKIAKFVGTTKQRDEYYTPAHRNFLEPKFPFEWLRIRKKKRETTLNYKHWYPETSETFTHCDEFEIKLQSAEQMEKIFSALNFRKLVTVDNERTTYVYRDELEIALDKVKGLGLFIEIEAKKDLGGVDATRERLFEFARTLGIDTSNPDRLGYPRTLLKKRGLIK